MEVLAGAVCQWDGQFSRRQFLRVHPVMWGREIMAVSGQWKPMLQPAEMPVTGTEERSGPASIHIHRKGLGELNCRFSPGSLGIKGLPELFTWFDRWSLVFRLFDSTQQPPMIYIFFFFFIFTPLSHWNLIFSLPSVLFQQPWTESQMAVLS